MKEIEFKKFNKSYIEHNSRARERERERVNPPAQKSGYFLYYFFAF